METGFGKVCFDKNDLKLYNKLPGYARKKLTMCTMSKTLDGWHCSINFINRDGNEDFIDEYGIGEFLATVRLNKEIF